jgi:hypothetical protein
MNTRESTLAPCQYTARSAVMADRTTPPTAIRVPRSMWAAYDRVCGRLGTSRSDDMLGHIRERIRDHGDELDLADLAAAEEELAVRRSRKGGRPPKAT